MDAALVVADRDGRIVHWNEHAERLFGHRADEVVGQPVDVIVPEAYRVRHWDGFYRAMAIYVEPAGGEQAWGPVLEPLGAA